MNISAPKYVKQTLLNIKEQIELDPVIVGNLNPSHSSTDRNQTQKINKDNLQ
jgi:hypothetical protein